ncbi:MAG: hypothetical protein J0H94_17005 [Rhizobiales bacterium]|nr:hypothetical protein [Hyphomicrobiales bacterium]
MTSASRLMRAATTAALAILLPALAIPLPAQALPKGHGGGICDCICASDATDPASHQPLYTGDVSFTPNANGCNSVLDNAGDCAVKDSSGHSVPGRLHSCSLRPGSTAIKKVPIGSVKLRPLGQ